MDSWSHLEFLMDSPAIRDRHSIWSKFTLETLGKNSILYAAIVIETWMLINTKTVYNWHATKIYDIVSEVYASPAGLYLNRQ